MYGGKHECFVMQMLYVCALCASCGSSQCCILHDLQFVNVSRGCKRQPYGRGNHMEEATIWKRHTQVRRYAYAVYTKRMEEENARKDNDMKQKAKTSKEDQDT